LRLGNLLHFLKAVYLLDLAPCGPEFILAGFLDRSGLLTWLFNLEPIHQHCQAVFTFTLDDLLTPDGQQRLRDVFYAPESFRAPLTTEQVTKQAAQEFSVTPTARMSAAARSQ
jgi:hypothetical protein